MTRQRLPMGEPWDELYEWLAANGVDEWIPERPTFVIDPAAGTLTYTSFRFTGPRGWDPEHLSHHRHGCDVDRRTVPLLAPPSDRIRQLIPVSGAALVEPRWA